MAPALLPDPPYDLTNLRSARSKQIIESVNCQSWPFHSVILTTNSSKPGRLPRVVIIRSADRREYSRSLICRLRIRKKFRSWSNPAADAEDSFGAVTGVQQVYRRPAGPFCSSASWPRHSEEVGAFRLSGWAWSSCERSRDLGRVFLAHPGERDLRTLDDAAIASNSR